MGKKKNISILGAYGYKKPSINGQSIKTRVFTERLKALSNKGIISCDTLGWKESPFRTLLSAFKCFMRSDTVFLMPGRNGMKLLPFYCLLKKIFGNRLRMIAVGGWLPEYIQAGHVKKEYFKQIDMIYVQSDAMHKKLVGLGLGNVVTMPNSRFFDLSRTGNNGNFQPSHIVFFSRVSREKA